MTEPDSFFASPERTPTEGIAPQAQALGEARFCLDILNFVPTPMMVLNENRQMLAANQALLTMFEELGLAPVPGMRPGEALGCVYSTTMPAGCGTSEYCQECGACQAILDAEKGQTGRRECRLTFRVGEVLRAAELEVTAAPLDVQGKRYTILSLLDVSHQKRRQALERIFFHDLMNSAFIVSGYASLLGSLDKEHAGLGVQRILQAAQRLIEEIQIQRDLLSAEQGDLQPVTEPVHPEEALRQVAAGSLSSPLARGLTLEVQPVAELPALTTDRLLLRRVLSNMVKNALEASAEGETVAMGVRPIDSEVEFWVHNSGSIPRNQQLQVFQRSFSTKDRNRGLGTYSMKLLAENYLSGRVAFESTPEEGTTFRLRIPFQAPPPSGVERPAAS